MMRTRPLTRWILTSLLLIGAAHALTNQRSTSAGTLRRSTAANAPLEKAVALLGQLKQKAGEEKHAEEVLYAQYNQFMKHETARFEAEIEQTTTQAADASARAESLRAESEQLSHEVFEKLKPALISKTEELKAGNGVDQQAIAIYLAEERDYRQGIKVLDKAAAHLRAARHVNEKMRRETLVQVETLKKTLARRRGRVSAKATNPPFLADTNVPGNTLNVGGKNGRMPGHMSANQCASACAELPMCVGYVFVKSEAASEDNCEIKIGWGGAVAEGCCDAQEMTSEFRQFLLHGGQVEEGGADAGADGAADGAAVAAGSEAGGAAGGADGTAAGGDAAAGGEAGATAVDHAANVARGVEEAGGVPHAHESAALGNVTDGVKFSNAQHVMDVMTDIRLEFLNELEAITAEEGGRKLAWTKVQVGDHRGRRRAGVDESSGSRGTRFIRDCVGGVRLRISRIILLKMKNEIVPAFFFFCQRLGVLVFHYSNGAVAWSCGNKGLPSNQC